MKRNDYLEIILEGSIKPQFFTDHLNREWKKAKNKDYSIDEFIEGLLNANNFIKNTLEDKKMHEISLLYQFFRQEQEAGRQVENKKELIDEQNQIEYTFNPAHYNLNRYAGQFKSLKDVIYFNNIINQFKETYNTKKMKTTDEDILLASANKEIERYNIDMIEEKIAMGVVGSITLKDVINVELNHANMKLEEANLKGHGNIQRLFKHVLNVLIEIQERNGIVIKQNSETKSIIDLNQLFEETFEACKDNFFEIWGNLKILKNEIQFEPIEKLKLEFINIFKQDLNILSSNASKYVESTSKIHNENLKKYNNPLDIITKPRAIQEANSLFKVYFIYNLWKNTNNNLSKFENSKTSKIMNPSKTNDLETQNKLEPIIWTGDNVLLGYLIQWLKEEGLISKKSARDSIIKNHFVNDKGKPIENIKQALSNMKAINNGGLPRGFEKIHPLLKTLKDLL